MYKKNNKNMNNILSDEEIETKINELKINIKKYKILSIISITMQFIFSLIKEILDYIYTLEKIKEEIIKKKFFLLIINGIIFCIITIIIIIQNINFLILSSIFYLVFGIIVFLYLFIQRYSTTPSHAKPVEYFEKNIDLINKILYYLSGIFIFFGSILIFIYVRNLSNLITLKKNKQKMLEENLNNNNTNTNEGLFNNENISEN